MSTTLCVRSEASSKNLLRRKQIRCIHFQAVRACELGRELAAILRDLGRCPLALRDRKRLAIVLKRLTLLQKHDLLHSPIL